MWCQGLWKCKIGKPIIIPVGTAAYHMVHDFLKNNDLGVGGNVKFSTEAIFLLMTTKIIIVNWKIVF